MFLTEEQIKENRDRLTKEIIDDVLSLNKKLNSLYLNGGSFDTSTCVHVNGYKYIHVEITSK